MKTLCSLSAAYLLFLHCAFAGSERTEAQQVFDRYYAQTCSSERHKSVTTLHVTGEVEVDGDKRPFSLNCKAPGMILFTVKEPGGREFRAGRDASARFWQEGAIKRTEQSPYGEIHELVFAWFPHARASAFERLGEALCERDSAAGRAVWSTGLRGHVRSFPRFLFDVETGALVGVGRSRFTDYQTFQGFSLPRKVTQGARATYRVSSIGFSETMDDSQFAAKGRDGWLSNFSQGTPTAPKSITLLNYSNSLGVVRHPGAAKPSGVRHVSLNGFDPNSGRHAQVDVRGADVSRLDLRNRKDDLMHADFDSHTKWPTALPQGFNPDALMRLGTDPGLHVSSLHARGITGQGIGIGIVDSPLLTKHREYADRLRLYEEIRVAKGSLAHMHGTAVASLAVGKTCGVAPEADLYFIASENYVPHPQKRMELDFTAIAKSVHRLLDINSTLPEKRKIRVISLSMGWGGVEKGATEMNQAVRRAESQRVFVLSTALRQTHGLEFHGLGRRAEADPNTFESYTPGSWWANTFFAGEVRFKPGTRLCAPMDARTTASPTGINDYTHYDSSGWSWTVQWIAGLYALGCQVNPELSPQKFWHAAIATGRTIAVKVPGETIPLGSIADPLALIEALEANDAPHPDFSDETRDTPRVTSLP